MKIVHHRKSEAPKRAQQGKSATRTNYRETEQNLEKPAKETCTIAHKWITGCQLSGHYGLVKIKSNKQFVKTLTST